MEETDFQSKLRHRLSLRVGPEMAKYLLKKTTDGSIGDSKIPAMGTHSLTGIPLRREIPLSDLQALTQNTLP